MYYKVLAKVKNYTKSHIYVVDASSSQEAKDKVWEHIRQDYPSQAIERITVSSEWIWDVIL